MIQGSIRHLLPSHHLKENDLLHPEYKIISIVPMFMEIIKRMIKIYIHILVRTSDSYYQMEKLPSPPVNKSIKRRLSGYGISRYPASLYRPPYRSAGYSIVDHSSK